LRPINKRIHSPEDITIFKHKRVKPINYINTISLNKLEVSEKKQKFFHMILPAILMSKHKFKMLRDRAKRIINSRNPSAQDLVFLDKMYKKFKTDNNRELLIRMKTHPVSIVLLKLLLSRHGGSLDFLKREIISFGMWHIIEKSLE